jgi:hypothetical protein
LKGLKKKKKTTKSEKIDARKVKKKILALKIFSQSAKKSMSEESRKNGLKVVKKNTGDLKGGFKLET